ncbi:hypothetical protein FPSE_06483 [Fusarium pseudograminearum CS3096]|uniref:Uncharacterized protein n=1 Tax=Fusarium pseudograminearum (strain CS3096) TaxID=1028729 RepID=K3UMH5_FUSPC|nr:hypothetical protein FPSE_06483 [Fusarium pseudograminearum CS3096]EKJ73326.1 hypothetical protein FPSE_06483 [Fusarium pseudograminearum CS3096]
MYIPLSLPHLHGSVADTQDHGSLQTTLLAFQALMKLLCSSCSRTGQYPTGNIKRQFSDNPSKNNDIKIGLIVGFTLAAFLAIVITFLYFYYGSARFTFRKKKKNHRHQHHHHPHHPPRHRRHKSLSSGGSGLSNNSAPPPAPPADDAPPKDKPADGSTFESTVPWLCIAQLPSLNFPLAIQVKHTALYPACSLSAQRNSASPILRVSEAHPSRSVYGSAVDVDPKDGMQAQAAAESSRQQNPVCDRVCDVDSLDGVGKRGSGGLARIRNFLGSLRDQQRGEQQLDVVCENGDDDEDECESVVSYVASGPFGTLLV